jgi:ribonuclease G
LTEIAAENPDAQAFLVQINPRVSTQFTGQGSRALHALEAQTGKFFHFEGSEGLALDHFAITFQGTREEVEERALPFHEGDEVLVAIVEPHMYDVDDAVAKIDGYIISIAGAATHVGEKRLVRIEQVGRTAATALLLDEKGEVIHPPTRPGRSQDRRSEGSGGSRRSKAQNRRRRAPADNEDAETRLEAGLGGSPTASDAEPEQEGIDAPSPAAEGQPSEEEAAGPDAPGEDDLQSKPRRRGRRGGRRRLTAKTRSDPE